MLLAQEGQKQAWTKEKKITQEIKKGALLKRPTAHRNLSPHTLQQEIGTSTCGPQMQAQHQRHSQWDLPCFQSHPGQLLLRSATPPPLRHLLAWGGSQTYNLISGAVTVDTPGLLNTSGGWAVGGH